MNRLSIARYVKLGLNLRYLRDIASGQPIHGDDYVVAQIGRFVQQLEKMELNVTRRLAEPLSARGLELSVLGAEAFLADRDAEDIRSMAREIERTLVAEASEKEVFEAQVTRFRTTDLLDDVGILLAQDIYTNMCDIAKRDFAESGRCLVVGRATATAFHVLRSTEAELRELYMRYVKTRRIAKPWMWGPLTNHIKSRKRKPEPELLELLDHIRKLYRNPTQHPEAEYTIDEAQDLFGLCSQALNRMVLNGR